MTPNNLLPKSRIALKREDFQAEVNGKETDLFILKNKNEMEIALENDDNSVALVWMIISIHRSHTWVL